MPQLQTSECLCIRVLQIDIDTHIIVESPYQPFHTGCLNTVRLSTNIYLSMMMGFIGLCFEKLYSDYLCLLQNAP